MKSAAWIVLLVIFTVGGAAGTYYFFIEGQVHAHTGDGAVKDVDSETKPSDDNNGEGDNGDDLSSQNPDPDFVEEVQRIAKEAVQEEILNFTSQAASKEEGERYVHVLVLHPQTKNQVTVYKKVLLSSIEFDEGTGVRSFLFNGERVKTTNLLLKSSAYGLADREARKHIYETLGEAIRPVSEGRGISERMIFLCPEEPGAVYVWVSGQDRDSEPRVERLTEYLIEPLQ